MIWKALGDRLPEDITPQQCFGLFSVKLRNVVHKNLALLEQTLNIDESSLFFKVGDFCNRTCIYCD